FIFTHNATTDRYPLSLHDALPIYLGDVKQHLGLEVTLLRLVRFEQEHRRRAERFAWCVIADGLRQHPRLQRHPGGRRVVGVVGRSEEHTSELQSLAYLVCRLLLEK